ncbi:hypothetical protein HJFPF1_00788 [Paramyrothecium foliicola]|nr:hypothetical protein HJFPF1_00788 [Paramyrothecium foliicola]
MSSRLPASSPAQTTQPLVAPTRASTWSTSLLDLKDRQAITESLPPMTTHWTRPATCTWTYDGDNQPQATGAIAWLDLKPIPHATTLSCYPDGMFSYGQTGVFSPATCPDNWTTATARVNTKENKEDEVTTVICCSSDYSFDGAYCKRSVPTVLAVPISYNKTIGTYSIVTTSTTTLYSATIAVHTIQALFQEKDRAVLGITDEVGISKKSDNHGLSLGAQIGIGIGVTAAVVLLVGTIMFLFARRGLRRNGQSQAAPPHSADAGYEETGHLSPIYAAGDRIFDGDRSRSKRSQAVSESSATTSDTYAPPVTESREGLEKDDEIKALRSQQADLQRRIEELEKTETDNTRG